MASFSEVQRDQLPCPWNDICTRRKWIRVPDNKQVMVSGGNGDLLVPAEVLYGPYLQSTKQEPVPEVVSTNPFQGSRLLDRHG